MHPTAHNIITFSLIILFICFCVGLFQEYKEKKDKDCKWYAEFIMDNIIAWESDSGNVIRPEPILVDVKQYLKECNCGY